MRDLLPRDSRPPAMDRRQRRGRNARSLPLHSTRRGPGPHDRRRRDHPRRGSRRALPLHSARWRFGPDDRGRCDHRPRRGHRALLLQSSARRRPRPDDGGRCGGHLGTAFHQEYHCAPGECPARARREPQSSPPRRGASSICDAISSGIGIALMPVGSLMTQQAQVVRPRARRSPPQVMSKP